MALFCEQSECFGLLIYSISVYINNECVFQVNLTFRFAVFALGYCFHVVKQLPTVCFNIVPEIFMLCFCSLA